MHVDNIRLCKAQAFNRDGWPLAGHQMGGRKDLGGADSAAHAGNVQQVPAAQLLEHAAATQGVQQVTPGHDHTGYPGKFDFLYWRWSIIR